MSPSASWAWSVMPMVTRPSASSLAHSWDWVYFRSAGTFMLFSWISIVVKQNFAIAHEGRLDHRRLQALVANFHLDLVADRDAGGQARQGDRRLMLGEKVPLVISPSPCAVNTFWWARSTPLSVSSRPRVCLSRPPSCED